jgi:diguanylate cyclase (GGDEF)-like protein/PAS domain S-box-containing protein
VDAVRPISGFPAARPVEGGVVFDAIDSPIAVVDATGRIIAVNAAWARTAAATPDPSRCGVGVSYLSVCEHASGPGSDGALDVAVGLRDVLSGRRSSFAVDYAIRTPSGTRWHNLRISPTPEGGAVLVHHDVTALRLAELSARFDDARVLRAVDESSPIFCLIDPDRTIAYVSDRTCELLGLARDELVGAEVAAFVEPADLERVRGLYQQVAAVPGERRPVRFRVLDGDRRRRDVDATLVNLIDDPGVRAVALVGSDVTDSRVHEITSRLEGRLMERFPAAVVITDRDGVIAYWNPRAETLTGVRAERAVGRRLDEIGVTAGDRQVDQEVTRSLVESGRWEGEYEFIVPGGTVLPLHLSLERVDDDDIDFHGLVGTAIDIADRRRLQDELAFQALHDPLTGLPNRRRFVEEVEAVLERAGGLRTALVFVDLDDFKELNDRAGHVVGDHALRVVAQRMREALRAPDLVARIGGDEFVAALVDVEDADDALAVAERVLQALRDPIVVDGVRGQLAGSVGVAMAQPGVGAELLLRNADAAMYQAKELGKNRIALFDDALRERARSRRAFAERLRAAVADGAIHAYFQPQTCLRTGALLGFEALARWEGDDAAFEGSASFLAVAEEGGVVGEIDRVVLAETVETLARFRAARPDLALRVSANVSGELLAEPTFPDQVLDLLGAHGVDASHLVIEVVESALADTDAVAESLRRLEAIGVEVSIDDFGTGYSSLSRIQHFHVDELKIDRSFVAGLGVDQERDAIVAAIIGLAEALGLRTIAEGVETDEQVARLVDLGVDAGQGYRWSPAVTADRALDLVRHAPPAGHP